MSIEIRDKRNNELLKINFLKNGDHFMYKNCLFIMSSNNYKSDLCLCSNIKDGTSSTINKSELVQQVHLVIEIHLV